MDKTGVEEGRGNHKAFLMCKSTMKICKDFSVSTEVCSVVCLVFLWLAGPPQAGWGCDAHLGYGTL